MRSGSSTGFRGLSRPVQTSLEQKRTKATKDLVRRLPRQPNDRHLVPAGHPCRPHHLEFGRSEKPEFLAVTEHEEAEEPSAFLDNAPDGWPLPAYALAGRHEGGESGPPLGRCVLESVSLTSGGFSPSPGRREPGGDWAEGGGPLPIRQSLRQRDAHQPGSRQGRGGPGGSGDRA